MNSAETTPLPLLQVLIPGVLQRLIWFPTRGLFTAFLRYRVKGREHHRALEGPCIIAANHVGELDPILVTAAFSPFKARLPLFYVSAPKEAYGKAFGLRGRLLYGGAFFRAWGAYPAYSGKSSYAEALLHHLPLLRAGRTICMFPNGRMDVPSAAGAKGGVAYLARATGAPVLPVHIGGIDGMTAREFWGGKRRVTLAFGTPLSADDIGMPQNAEAATRDECEAAARKVMEAVYALGAAV